MEKIKFEDIKPKVQKLLDFGYSFYFLGASQASGANPGIIYIREGMSDDEIDKLLDKHLEDTLLVELKQYVIKNEKRD